MRRLLILILVGTAGLIQSGSDVGSTIGYPYDAWLYL
jgi:hypothetical protein